MLLDRSSPQLSLYPGETSPPSWPTAPTEDDTVRMATDPRDLSDAIVPDPMSTQNGQTDATDAKRMRPCRHAGADVYRSPLGTAQVCYALVSLSTAFSSSAQGVLGRCRF